MRRWQRVTGLRGGLIALALLIGCTTVGLAQSIESIEYWRQYKELTSTVEPRVADAHRIFQRLVQVAGTRSNKVPRLFITAKEPWDIMLPIALPDGWIILSKRVLDICYRDPKQGDDRLAFVLAHELAHQLNGDLWHLHFFQAHVPSQPQGQPPDPELLAIRKRVLHAESHPEEVLKRELRADEEGIMYAAMAGFNPRAIVPESQDVNFFVDWVRAQDPRSLGGASVDLLPPTPQERAKALQVSLRRVADNAAVFQVGLWFYYAGDYPRALRAFAHFRELFPSREVSHNLATSHHQLALQAYKAWKQDAPPLPFLLSRTIDPLTRASIYLDEPTRGGTATPGTPAEHFRQHLEEAIVLYKEALARDAAYTPAALNLGEALIMRGHQTKENGLNPDFTEAVWRLQQALQHTPNTPTILNTLGVALFYDGKRAAAAEQLSRARKLEPTYAAPLFNLAHLARLAHQDANAQQYWSDYQRLVTPSPPGVPAPSQQRESVLGLTVGATEADVPQQWEVSVKSRIRVGKEGTAPLGPPSLRYVPVKSPVRLGKEAYAVAAYPLGKLLLVQDGAIRMIFIREGYQGKSARGLSIGSAAHEVLAGYGPPTRQVELTQGHSWSYDTQRIAFQLRDGKVVSWLLF